MHPSCATSALGSMIGPPSGPMQLHWSTICWKPKLQRTSSTSSIAHQSS